MEGILSKNPGAKPDETLSPPTETEIGSALEGLRRSNEQQQPLRQRRSEEGIMTTKPGKTSPPDALLEQAIKFIAEAPEEQFLQYLKESGENPQELSKMTADAVASAIKAFGQRQLAAVRAEQERKLASIEALRARISTYDGLSTSF